MIFSSVEKPQDRFFLRQEPVMQFEPVIGLEVHAQLKTRTKIFCGCSTAFGAPPNTHTCPVCLGMPGVLPVLNHKVVEYTLRMALATGCRVAEKSRFARKNYFYPDLPKGYQISQYELPVAAARAHRHRYRRGPKANRDHPHSHGRGCRKADPRPGPTRQPGRPQPHRGAPDGDRQRAGHPLPRGSRGLPAQAAIHRPLPRHQRRQPGRGQLPLRRQHLHPADGNASLSAPAPS